MTKYAIWKPEDEARLLQLCYANQTPGRNGLACLSQDAWREIAALMERTVRACQDKFWTRNGEAGKKLCYRPRAPSPPQALQRQTPFILPEPASITAFIFGDPLPGRSALDRKMAGHHHG